MRELFAPECAAVRPGSLRHNDVRVRIAQRVRPPPCVFKKERLLCAGNEVRARKRTRHRVRRLVTAARRGAEDGAVNIRMPKPDSERQFSARRDAEHRGTLSGQRHAKPRLRPSANVLDEELLMRREPLRLKARRVLMEPSVSSAGPCIPTIIVDGALIDSILAFSINRPHFEILWPSPAKTIASGGLGGTYTVTCRPPSYSNVPVTNSPETMPVGLAGAPSDSGMFDISIIDHPR